MKYLGKGKSQSMVLYNHASVIQDVKKKINRVLHFNNAQ